MANLKTGVTRQIFQKNEHSLPSEGKKCLFFEKKKTPVLRFTPFFLLIEELFNLTVGFQIKKCPNIFKTRYWK